jgi:hypothetical protein
MVGRGVLAGLPGTAVVTAFQKLAEMPLTGHEDRYAPADFVERVLTIHPQTDEGPQHLNYATHFLLGTMGGSAYGLAAASGMRHPRKASSHGSARRRLLRRCPADTSLGLYQPSTWSGREIIDVGEKFIQAASTGAAFDRLGSGSPSLLAGAPKYGCAEEHLRSRCI